MESEFRSIISVFFFHNKYMMLFMALVDCRWFQVSSSSCVELSQSSSLRVDEFSIKLVRIFRMCSNAFDSLSHARARMRELNVIKSKYKRYFF